jgi:alkanesulfonate monooxygenase SsuD/methylene tetrahydromethanopterin reductase-like flavin-dependent oxidoreductase (luciferase family)
MANATARLKSGHRCTGGKDEAFAFACEVVRRADELGFDTTLIAERFLGPDLEAWVLASALAVVTRRLELMVAVHPGMVTPQVVAKMGSSLDRISGGRFAINIVNGWWKEEFDLFSNGTWIGDAERYPRMGEFIAVLKGLWTDSDFNFEGAFYRAHVRAALTGADGKVAIPDAGDVIAKPAHLPYPPIYAASRSPEGKALIARHCDVWFAEYKPGYRNFESNIERMSADLRAMDALAAKHGRTLALCHQSPGDLLRHAGRSRGVGRRGGASCRPARPHGQRTRRRPRWDTATSRAAPAPLCGNRHRLRDAALHADDAGRRDVRDEGHSAAALLSKFRSESKGCVGGAPSAFSSCGQAAA